MHFIGALIGRLRVTEELFVSRLAPSPADSAETSSGAKSSRPPSSQ
ncbi:hypothetical protein R3I94_016330 [Phoxinus phoxinus]